MLQGRQAQLLSSATEEPPRERTELGSLRSYSCSTLWCRKVPPQAEGALGLLSLLPLSNRAASCHSANKHAPNGLPSGLPSYLCAGFSSIIGQQMKTAAFVRFPLILRT